MRPAARLFPSLCVSIAALVLGCEPQPATAPPPSLSLAKDPPGLEQACREKPGERLARRPNAPVALLCAITVPGNPIQSGTKSWIDDQTERFYLTDVSNAGVDMIDAETNAYLGRVTGFVGATGVAATSGPNSIVFTDLGQAWVSDGNSTVKVVDVANQQIVASVSTAIPACDDGTAHFCQRTNEITYDPEHQIVFVQNPSPLAVAAPHGAIDTYATFISAVPPYAVLGTISFPDRRGQEGPLWDPEQHRILTAVSGRLVGTTVFQQYVAVIDPAVRPFTIEKKFDIDCPALGLTGFGINDPALGPDGHMVIPGCGKALIMDARTGAITVITQIGGGNETWYNPGDGRFYVTGVDVTTGRNSLGAIDARTSTWLQSVPAPQATNPTAFADNNRIFAVVQVTANQVAGTAADTSACAQFGVIGRGCITVFAHVGNAGNDSRHR